MQWSAVNGAAAKAILLAYLDQGTAKHSFSGNL